MSTEPETTSTAPESIDVYQVTAILIEQMASIAWQKLGLQPDPIAGKVIKDLGQAKVAIDIVGELSHHLIPQLDGSDARRIQNLVSDLKINFVQKSAEASS